MLANLSSGAESKVYYDYNYRVLPAPVSTRRSSDSRGQASSHSRARPAWLPPPGQRSEEYVIDYYDPEEEFGER